MAAYDQRFLIGRLRRKRPNVIQLYLNMGMVEELEIALAR